MANEYHESHCDQKSPKFIHADQMLLAIVTEIKAKTAVNTQQKEANALQQSIQTTATHLQSVVQAPGQ